jgi:hypothetical protein
MVRNKDSNTSISSLITNYVAIITLVPFVATLVGDGIYYSRRFNRHNVAAGSFEVAVVIYVFEIVDVVIVGAVIWKLAPTFASKADQTKAMTLAAYGYTPIALIGIVDFIPQIGPLTFLGLLYGAYIVYVGLPILMATPKDRVITYLVAIVIVGVVVYAAVDYLTLATVHSALSR